MTKKLNLLNLNEQIHLNLLNLNKSFGAGRATSVGKTSIAKGTRTVFAEMAKECEKVKLSEKNVRKLNFLKNR